MHGRIDASGQVVAPGSSTCSSLEFSILRGRTVSKITQGITQRDHGEVSSAWPNVALGEQPNPKYPCGRSEILAHLEKTESP